MNPKTSQRSLKSMKLTVHLHWHYMGLVFLLCLLFAVCSTASVWLLSQMQSDLARQFEPELAEYLEAEQLRALVVFGVQVGLFLTGLVFTLMLTAHRIAGPRIALMRVFQRVRDGETTARLKFREYDRLEDVEKAFNEMMEARFPGGGQEGGAGPGESVPRKGAEGMTLIEIMIVVVLIGLLATLALPTFLRPRENARTRICISNLRILDQAKELWAIERRGGGGGQPTAGELDPYIKRGIVNLRCPSGKRGSDFEEHYEVGTIEEPAVCRVEPLKHRH